MNNSKIELKINHGEKVYLETHQIIFEQKAKWLGLIFLFVPSLLICIFFKIDLLWFLMLSIIIALFFVGYKKSIRIGIDGSFEQKTTFFKYVLFEKTIQLRKTILHIELYDIANEDSYSSAIGYLFRISLKDRKQNIIRITDRSKVLKIIRFLKENNYTLKGWNWDY